MALDPVNHKALKGKFKDREDKDIDNDGDVDSSDEYLHKRRQAVSKAIGKIKEAAETLDEVSDKKLDAYRQKAFADQPSGDDGSDKYRKRKFGRDLAFAKQTGRAKVLATKESVELDEKRGLWDNIHAKRKRIAAGSGEKMRKPGSKGAPSADSLKNARESVEHITESENRDYIKTVLSRHLNHNKVAHKVSSAVGYDKFDVGNNTHISHDGVGLSVKHKGKEVAYYSKPRLEYKDAAKTALKHSMKEEVEQIDEISRDLARRYIRKVADKTNAGELDTKQVMKHRPGVNLAGKKAYPGIAGEPKVRATESAEFKTEAKDGDGANIVRDREFKGSKFKFKSHPYGSPEWHANKAAYEKFKAKEAAKKAMKKEEVEQIDEIQINWGHKTQKYHTIKHPDGSHWGVFDHSSYGTKGHEIRKIRDSEGNAIKASDSRRNHSSGYKSGMGSPSEAAKEWAKKHGGTITNHKIKEEVEKKPTELPADKKPLRLKLAHFRHQE